MNVESANLSWFQIFKYLKGNRVSIYGPELAGKSHFFDYLRLGILQHEERTTDPTPYFVTNKRKRVKYTTDNFSSEVVFRYTRDSPGQTNVGTMVSDIASTEPHFIFLIFDATRPRHVEGSRHSGGLSWLEFFAEECERQEHQLLNVKSTLTGIAILWSKCDKVTEADISGIKSLQDKDMSPLLKRASRYLGLRSNQTRFYLCSLLAGRTFPTGSNGKVSEHEEAIKFMITSLSSRDNTNAV